jgi:hypothetical protein
VERIVETGRENGEVCRVVGGGEVETGEVVEKGDGKGNVWNRCS